MKELLLSLLLIVCVPQFVAAVPIDDLRKSAESGDEKSMFILGEQYKYGIGGLEKDEEEAVIWYRKLADKGSPWGQYALGDCFREGSGVAQNYEKAVYWYKKAAEQGDGSAQYRLARCYLDGQGVEKNEQESFKWMAKASESNSMSSVLELGLYYAAGIGVNINLEQSLACIRRAAEDNSAMAQCIIGLSYMYGNGVDRNLNDASIWLGRSAEMFSMATGDFKSLDLTPLLLRAGIKGHATFMTAYGINLHNSIPDFPPLKPSVEERAKQGDEQLQFILGMAYMAGMGIERNTYKAVEWLNKAAVNGHQGGKAFMASYGTNDYEAAAVRWFREEGEKGNTDALVALGFCYSAGLGVSRNEQEAVNLYLKAAEKNNAQAQFMMCVRYGHGMGVDEDNEKANIWFKRALDNKYRKAVLLATPLPEITPGATPADPIDPNLLKDAQQGSADAQYMLAGHYAFGEGETRNPAQAFTWYHKAAEQGHVDALYFLAECYANGDGCDKDLIQAATWYEKAAEQNHIYAQYKLGACYKNGDGVEVDPVKAAQWFQKAAERGNLYAQYYLGDCYATGSGVEKDTSQALSWFLKAAEQDNPVAQFELGRRYAMGEGVEKDLVQSFAWFKKAAEHEYFEQAQYVVGLNYAQGEGVEKDLVQAANWYQKAAENGLAAAQNSLGICYQIGTGVSTDLVQAVVWYRKSAEQGNAEAQKNLATCYLEGIGVEKDFAQAVAWYRKAAEQDDKDAQFNLGICYAKGEGVETDYAQSLKWVRKAAEQGLPIAHANLGKRYRDGEGVLQDDRQACVHFLIAGALGYPNTSLFVDKLRDERLSVAQYNDAQRLANAWIEKFRSGTPKGISPEDEPMAALLERKPPSTGSGFVISSDGYFLTCAHVLAGGGEIKIRLGTKTYPAKLIRADTHNDVALLKLDGTEFQPMPLSYNLPEMGDKVFTVGYPNPDLQGASAKYTDGSISSLSGILDDIRTMQITVPIQGGNSGGPLVDESGNALGLVVAQLNAAAVFEYTGTIPQNVNFAIKIGYALPLVQSVPDLARNLPQPRMANPDARPVDEVQAATGLVLVYE